MTHPFAQTTLVDCSDLFAQNNGILSKPVCLGKNVDVRRKSRFTYLTRYRRSDHRRAVSVPDVILNDQNRTKPSLLAPDHGTQIGIINVSPFDVQEIHTLFVLRAKSRIFRGTALDSFGKFLLSDYIFSVSECVLINNTHKRCRQIFTIFAPEATAQKLPPLILFYFNITLFDSVNGSANPKGNDAARRF